MWNIVNNTMVKYRGLSTDTKPAAENGSSFFEMDTGDLYLYDGENSVWIKFGGGGGSSAVVGTAIVGTSIVG